MSAEDRDTEGSAEWRDSGGSRAPLFVETCIARDYRQLWPVTGPDRARTSGAGGVLIDPAGRLEAP